MAIKPPIINFDKEQFLSFLPLIVCGLAIILLVFVFLPLQISKAFSLMQQLAGKKNNMVLVERSSQNLNEIKKEIATTEEKISQLEKRLPKQIETTLLIDTLKDITQEARLKFSSIEPAGERQFELEGQDEFYLELPIKVKLRCSFFDLIAFVQKIENSSRLMKISELAIRNNPQDIWEHNVDLAISTFAMGKK